MEMPKDLSNEDKERIRKILSEAFAPLGVYQGIDGKLHERNEAAMRRFSNLMDYRR